MPRPPPIDIDPPLLNSANPWATDVKDLRALYDCRYTGAVTTRTSLIGGFNHDAAAHQYAFFDAAAGHGRGTDTASVNSLGYSPHTLDEYLSFIREVLSSTSVTKTNKGFIVSITGDPDDVVECYRRISSAQRDVAVPLAMEINLSCPNIPGAPPPAYDAAALLRFLNPLRDLISGSPELPRIPFGLKTPPYTHLTEYQVLINALRTSAGPQNASPVSFITATNTLGSCLVLSSTSEPPNPVLPGHGLGGMAGAPLHPLALGNVATIRRMLDENGDQLGHIQIIGVGGVLDSAGYERMKSVGAYAVAVGTGLGIKGVGIFQDIAEGVRKT